MTSVWKRAVKVCSVGSQCVRRYKPSFNGIVSWTWMEICEETLALMQLLCSSFEIYPASFLWTWAQPRLKTSDINGTLRTLMLAHDWQRHLSLIHFLFNLYPTSNRIWHRCPGSMWSKQSARQRTWKHINMHTYRRAKALITAPPSSSTALRDIPLCDMLPKEPVPWLHRFTCIFNILCGALRSRAAELPHSCRFTNVHMC